jgi:hypothetical protein
MLKKLRSRVALYADRIEIELDGNYDIYSKDDIIDVFISGFCRWAGESLEDEEGEGYERNRIYETYRRLRNNPWSVAWETALTAE